MNIQPIVEGHGEVGAVPVLLRRLLEQANVFTTNVNYPIRKPRSQLVEEEQLKTAVRLALRQEECGAVLLLIDSDDDCPATLGPQIQAWAVEEAGQIPCVVTLAHREYEAWFLASIESLAGTRGVRDDATSHPNPETPRNAKGELESRLGERRTYSESADQTALSARLDLAVVHRSCRSFRHLVKVFGELLVALGEPLPNPWPPAGW